MFLKSHHRVAETLILLTQVYHRGSCGNQEANQREKEKRGTALQRIEGNVHLHTCFCQDNNLDSNDPRLY